MSETHILGTAQRPTTGRRVATAVVVLVMAATLVGCQIGKVGGKCKAGGTAQDATHVLVCKKGKWVRLISKADGMRELARIQAEQAAAAQPPATDPPAPAAPTTTPFVTEPPATVPPTTAPVVTVPPTPTTTPAPTTTTTPATSTTTTVAPSTTTTTPGGTTTTTTPTQAAGDLDGAFGTSGIAKFQFPKMAESVTATTSTDGGTTYLLTGYGDAARIRRLTASGDIDTTFASDGALSLPTLCQMCGIDVDGNGRLYFWSHVFQPNGVDLVVSRLTASGALDATYGTGGKVTVPVPQPTLAGMPGSFSTSAKVAVSDTGVVGFSSANLLGVRFISTDGTPGPAPATTTCSPLEMTFDHAGRLLVLSGACAPAASSLVMSRYLSDGTLDPSFGGGRVALAGSNFAMGRNLVVDASNRPYWGQDLTMHRLTTTGTVDTGYGVNGVGTFATATNNSFASPDTAVLTENGIYVMLQPNSYPTPNAFVIAKLDNSGLPDTGFDGDGVMVPSPLVGTINTVYGSSFSAAKMLRSGSGVLAVSTTVVDDPMLGQLPVNALLKVRSDGGTESAFGNNGLVTTRTGIVGLSYTSSAPGPAGSVYLVFRSAGGGAVILRFTSTGALDPAFSGDGALPLPLAQAVGIDPAGRVLAYNVVDLTTSLSFGSAGPINRNLQRYSTAGVPDTTFNHGSATVAWASLVVPSSTYLQCAATITGRADGDVVVAYGPASGSPQCSSTGLDLVHDGAVQSGWAPTLPSHLGGRRVIDVAATADNHVFVLAGSSAVPGESGQRLVRLDSSGSPTASFGGNGDVDLPTSSGADLAPLPDGSVLVISGSAGSLSFAPATDMTAQLVLANGTRATIGAYGVDGEASLTGMEAITAAGSHFVGVGGSGFGIAWIVNAADAQLDVNFTQPGDDGMAGFTRGTETLAPVLSAQRLYVVRLNADSNSFDLLKFLGTVS